LDQGIRPDAQVIDYQGLLGKVIVYNPVPPPEVDGIGKIAHRGKKSCFGVRWLRRRWVKLNPAVRWEIGFHPAVGILLPDGPIVAESVVLADLKSIDQASRNPKLAQHYCHGRGEIFTMPASSFE
jgi:hypothetical protein